MRTPGNSMARLLFAAGWMLGATALAQNVPSEQRPSPATEQAPSPQTEPGAAQKTEAEGPSAPVTPSASSPAQPRVAPPKDVAYPGILSLRVEATDLLHHVFQVHERVPVDKAGPFTLLFPQWLPGHHSPNGPLDALAGLTIQANGKRVPWRRDPLDVFAFHVDVPRGARALEVSFQFLSPVTRDEGRIVMTPKMLNLQWNTVALYPAGHFAHRIRVSPTVVLPKGWGFGCALKVVARANETVRFETVPFDTLVDSPLFAGEHFRRVDLAPGAKVPVHLDVVADRPDLLEISREALKAHRALITQAYALFGAHHYDHYDFLLSVSDRMSGIGLEHHRSSEDGVTRKYFTDWKNTTAERDLLPHEFTHSWNGKFRRPADLWTPNYSVPMQDSLLWVYEGQTQYWGYVLAARSGLWTQQEALDALAVTAATYANHRGRRWRPLEDTTNDPIIANRKPIPWRNWQLSEDYYSAGQLMWLEVDTLLRERSGGKRSLDDFAQAFFGIDNGRWDEATYTFEDVVKTLNGLVPYDWAKFLHHHLEGLFDGASLEGVERGGYKLVYTDEESPFQKTEEALRKAAYFNFSLGFIVDQKSDSLIDVQVGSPAYRAGLTVGTKLLAVDGEHFDADDLKDAILWAKSHKTPIKLLVEQNKYVREVTLDYHEGPRYPHLVPTGKGPRSLDAIFAPK